MKTDTQLQQQVMAGLAREGPGAVDISVGVKDGIVTLTGPVACYADKWDAEQAARMVTGVRALVVALDVVLPGCSERDDVDIARATDDALRLSILVPADVVRVAVQAGQVTLAGETTWNFQREAAARTVRKLVGVTGVTNRITVAPRVTTPSKEARTEVALQGREHRRARQIAVTVDGAELT